MKTKQVKITFEAKIPFDTLIDEETFRDEYDNDILRLCRFMWKEEGFWFDEKLKLTKAELI